MGMAGTSSNDIEINPALYYMYTDTLSLIFNVLAHERSSLHEALYYTMVLSLYSYL